MSSTQSASGSRKTVSAGTPFDQITTREQAERERVTKEIDAFAAEKLKISASILAKEQREEEALRNAAKEDLKNHSEQECAPLLKKADSDAQTECDALVESSSQNKREATDFCIHSFLKL